MCTPESNLVQRKPPENTTPRYLYRIKNPPLPQTDTLTIKIQLDDNTESWKEKKIPDTLEESKLTYLVYFNKNGKSYNLDIGTPHRPCFKRIDFNKPVHKLYCGIDQMDTYGDIIEPKEFIEVLSYLHNCINDQTPKSDLVFLENLPEAYKQYLVQLDKQSTANEAAGLIRNWYESRSEA